MPRLKSRSARWANAIAIASKALEELVDIRDEYQEWRNDLPENTDLAHLEELWRALRLTST